MLRTATHRAAFLSMASMSHAAAQEHVFFSLVLSFFPFGIGKNTTPACLRTHVPKRRQVCRRGLRVSLVSSGSCRWQQKTLFQQSSEHSSSSMLLSFEALRRLRPQVLVNTRNISIADSRTQWLSSRAGTGLVCARSGGAGSGTSEFTREQRSLSVTNNDGFEVAVG